MEGPGRAGLSPILPGSFIPDSPGVSVFSGPGGSLLGLCLACALASVLLTPSGD